MSATREPILACFICREPILKGQMVLPDYTEGLGHRACFGDDREGFCNLETGEPLGPDEPLPTGEPYDPDAAGAIAEEATREDIIAQIAHLTEEHTRTSALHSARVTELLEANNREVERRRIAERALEATSFQARVGHWMQACFGPAISADRLERGDRLLEEVLELLQSGGYPPERVAALTGYVWSRPAGQPPQEVGGVEVTLAAYCLAHGLDKHEAGETELARIWTKVEAIRAKQAAKPTGSALPVAQPFPQAQES